MTEKETLDGIERLDPFFAEIAKYEKQDKKESREDEFTGKSANLKIEEKWNVKMQFGTLFFTELFAFLSELGTSTILRLNKRGAKIYVLDKEGTHASYTLIDRTEMSEFINIDDVGISETPENPEKLTDTDKETVIFAEFELDEMTLNEKYPVDVYFDTKEKNTMYIVNGKTIESRRLKSMDSKDDPTIGTYSGYYERLMKWLKDEESFIMNISYVSFGNILKSLEKKKSKKDKTISNYAKIEFRKNEIEFKIENEIKSSTFKMHGDDIATPGTRDTSFLMQLDQLTKLAKLKTKNNIILHINERLPLIVETKFGAGKIHFYYIMSPRTESEEQINNEEQNSNEEQSIEDTNMEEL